MKWIYFNKETRCFSPTEYANEICGFSATGSRPDQIKVDPQVEADSVDEDSIMEDVENVVDTPQTNASESQLASEESTRASTPSEEDVPPEIYTVEPSGRSDIADDVTMKDLGVKKSPPAGTTDEVGSLKVVSWPLETVIDPGSSPWKTEKPKEEILDFDSDPQKFEEFYGNDPDSPIFINLK